MINNILTNPTESNLTVLEPKYSLEQISPENVIITDIFELSSSIISESIRTIVFAGIQFTNTIHSLEYFYPSFDQKMMTEISEMSRQIIDLINQYYSSVRIFFSDSSDEKSLHNPEISKFWVFFDSLAEKSGVNNLINSFNYQFKKQAVFTLAEGTRKQIGRIVLRFQEKNLINQNQKEMEAKNE